MKACATIDWQSSLSSDYPTSGGGPDGNAHYRDAAAVIDNRSSWPAAFDWLISCAERFKQVFGPRIGQMEVPGAPGTAAAFAAVEKLGPWSAWTPIEKSREAAPRKPGVYMARTGRHGPVIYVGMAGERSGRGTKTPQGINGRLSAYLTGQGLGGGLLGRSFELALSNPAWLRARIADLEAGKRPRAKDWGKAALVPHNLYVRWARSLDRHRHRTLGDGGPSKALVSFRAYACLLMGESGRLQPATSLVD